MSVALLLQTLRERGVELALDGDRLRSRAPKGALTPELAAQIRENKDELLRILGALPLNSAPLNPIPRVEERTTYPLSPVQQRNAYGAHLGPGLPTAFRLRGPLDKAALRDTLTQIVGRHAPLRSTFNLDGATPEQRVHEPHPVALEFVDLSAEQAPERALEARLREVSTAPFDLVTGPLFRFGLYAFDPHDHVFFMAVSQVVFDGWSFDVFLKELCRGYAALASGRPWPFEELRFEYVDFLSWQGVRLEQRRTQELAFWRAELGEVLPPGPLPLDRPRPAVPSHQGRSVPFGLTPELTVALRAHSQRTGVTVQTVMLAALQVLIARIGGAPRVVVATPIDGRNHPASEALLGSFVKLLLIPSSIERSESFVHFCAELQQRCVAAYEHQELPLEELRLKVERTSEAGLVPLWQVEFSYQQVSTRSTMMGPLSLSQVEVPGAGAQSELTLWVKDWGDRIGGAVDFASDVFDEVTVLHWRDCYCALLAEILAAPERRLGEFPMLGAVEREVVDRALAAALAAQPEWLGAFAEGATIADACFVDEEGGRLPAGAWGRLRVGEVTSPEPVRLRVTGALNRPVRSSVGQLGSDVPVRDYPLDHVETRICWAFASALSTANADDLHTNFFDAGGHSLAGVRLLGLVHAEFGVRLALGVLFEAPTPYLLARRVRAAAGIPDPETGAKDGAAPEWSPAVPIQPHGKLPPLFVAAGVGGNPMNLRHVARALGPDQPFFGLQHRGTDGQFAPHRSVRAMAEEYADHIVRTFPAGPYYLGGFSAGGVAAFETAHVLRDRGKSVRLVVMFDANSTVVQRPGRKERITHHVKQLRTRQAEYVFNGLKRRLEAKTDQLRLKIRSLLARWYPYQFRNEAVTTAWVAAAAEYRPEPYPGDVLLLRARLRDQGLDDPSNGWAPLVRGNLEIRHVDGGHTSHLSDEFAAGLATELSAALAAARANG